MRSHAKIVSTAKMKRVSAFLSSFLLLVSGALHATTVERLTLGEMVKKADRIVAGRVISERTHWSHNGNLILTTYTIEVGETIKGQAARTVEVTTLGGRIGNRELRVSGMPAFDAGEEAVVFIEKSNAVSLVVGLAQGKFSITNGEVSNRVSDLTFADGRPGRPLRMPYQSFRQQIKTLVGR
jgi:hypothetical protein